MPTSDKSKNKFIAREYLTKQENAKLRRLYKEFPLPVFLTQEERTRQELALFRSQIREAQKRRKLFKAHFLRCKSSERWFVEMAQNAIDKQINELSAKLRRIEWRSLPRAQSQTTKSFDLDRLKLVPIDTLVEVSARKTFKLRDEKTPSCYWYEKTNRWHDFGVNEGGDVIDLVQKLHGVDFKSACTMLEAMCG